MLINRRDFLKWVAGVAAATKVVDMSKLDVLASESAGAPSILWIQGASCTGCSVSVLNAVEPVDIKTAVLDVVDMEFHPNLSTLSGTSATGGSDYMKAMDTFATQNAGNFIMIVEGAIYEGTQEWNCVIGQLDGVDITAKAAVEKYGQLAQFVIATGACASFGGIPGSAPGAQVVTVENLLGSRVTNPVINLPSCPTHPTALVQTLVDLLSPETIPVLDRKNRPQKFYDKQIHSTCERRGTSMAKNLGEVGCYKQLGCKGPKTEAHCPSLFWNRYEENGVFKGGNYCMKSNHPCIGCASPDFPTNPLNV